MNKKLSKPTRIDSITWRLTGYKKRNSIHELPLSVQTDGLSVSSTCHTSTFFPQKKTTKDTENHKKRQKQTTYSLDKHFVRASRRVNRARDGISQAQRRQPRQPRPHRRQPDRRAALRPPLQPPERDRRIHWQQGRVPERRFSCSGAGRCCWRVLGVVVGF